MEQTTQQPRTPATSSRPLWRELWDYMRVRKKWWLLPVFIVLMTIGSLLILAQGSALAPFIYTLF